MTKRISLPEIVGGGYGEFWKSKERYRVVVGSRACKKSKTEALNMIALLMRYPESNGLIVRKTYRTLKDSCFAELKWAAKRLGVEELWEFKRYPLEAIYHGAGRTPQRLLFRGLDDPDKITSITVDNGYLCFVWIEEAYEIMREEDFDKLDGSIRGSLPDGLYHQITLTLNPWSDKHWIKRRFCDNQDDDTFYIQRNYKCNEWLSQQDLNFFEKMRTNRPKYYLTAGLGNWGVIDGLVYDNWHEGICNIASGNWKHFIGLDWGYSQDPAAIIFGAINTDKKKIYIYDEIYKKGLTNLKIANLLHEYDYDKSITITADSADPKSIEEVRSHGIKIKGSKKGNDSLIAGIQYLQNFDIIIHPKCINIKSEITTYVWDTDRFGNVLPRPIDANNHALDALRYGTEQFAIDKSLKLNTYDI